MLPRDQRLVVRAFEPADIVEFTQLLNMPGIIKGTLQQPFRSCAERAKTVEYFFPHLNIVAEFEGILVGHACLNLDSDICCRHVGTIDVVVHDNYRRKGIGQRLTMALLDHADDSIGLHRVELTVLAENSAAIVLYEKLGFVQEGKFRDYAFKGGRLVDAIPMARINPSVFISRHVPNANNGD